jgi:NADH:ubiquinone oxidoreductase subunit H
MHDFVQYVESYLGSDQTPGAAGNIFWVTVYVLLVFVGLSVAVIAMNWLERKILAHMQVRLGPMRVGPHGLLQPIADALKLLLKEDIIPAGADKVVFWIAPFIVVLAAFTVFVVVPFGPTHAITDMNIGILFMLGVSSLSVLGIVTAGWASNSHYPLIGALRSSAQMVSYEVAMGLAVVSAILMTSLNESSTGTLSMIGIVEAQKAQQEWFLLKFFPLGIIAFGIFAVAMVAENNRAPFDLPEAESNSPLDSIPNTAAFAGLCFPGGVFCDDCGQLDRSHAVVGWMDEAISQCPERPDLGSGLLVHPGTDIRVSGRIVLLQHSAHAQAPALQNPNHRACGIRSSSRADRTVDVPPAGKGTRGRHLLVLG